METIKDIPSFADLNPPAENLARFFFASTSILVFQITLDA